MERFYCDIWGQKINEKQCYLRRDPLEYNKNLCCLDCSKYKDFIPPKLEKASAEKGISNEKKPLSKKTYRKKPFSGKIVRDLKKESLDFFKELGKIPPKNILNFLEDKFGISTALKFGGEEKNPNLKIIVFCKNEELKKILIDLGNRGANLTTIWDALKLPNIDEYLLNGHPIGLRFREGELSPHWDKVVRNFETKKREFFKSQDKINKAIDVIAYLKPITLKHYYEDELAFANTKLLEAQNALSEFQRVINIYFNGKAKEEVIGYPAKWGMSVEELLGKEFRPFTQRSHKIWNRRIVILVDELQKIYPSDRQVYMKTAELLNLAFPNVYKDRDADLVRQRYTYHTRNRKGPVTRNKTRQK